MKRLLALLIKTYAFIGRFRSDECDTAEERKINELYNKGWFFIFGAVFSNLLATLAIVLLMLFTDIIDFDREQFTVLARAYIAVESVTCLLLAMIFLSGKRVFLGPAGPVSITAVIYAYYITLALFAGKDAGVHYILFQFFPMAIMMNTESRPLKAGFLLCMIMSTIVAFYAVNIIPPLYPLPGAVISIIFYMVLFFLVAYTLVAFYFTVWRLNYLDKLVQLWKKLVDLGSHHYATDGGVLGNRMSNQLFILFILVSVFNFVAITAAIVRAVNIDLARNIWYTVIFYPAWLFGFCSLLGSYYYKNKLGKNFLFEIYSIAVLAAIFILFLAVTGSDAGIHYYFSILIILPAFLNTDSRMIKAGMALFFLAIFLVMLGMPVRGVYPFPGEIERKIKNVTVSIITTSFILFIVFTWVRYDVTARLVRLWDRLTERGFHLFATESEKRLRKIQSSVILIFLAMIVVCFFIEMGLILHMYLFAGVDSEYVVSAALYYGSTSLAVILMLAAALYFQEKTRTILPAVLPFVPSIIWHFFMGISLSHETLITYFKLILLPLPYIALDRRDKIQRMFIASGILLIVVSFIANVAYHFRFEPLFPFPQRYNFPIAVSVVLTLTFTLILMSYYFFKQTSLAEANLEIEKKKSEWLLLNVLPAEIAEELKNDGISRPSRFENITVMFVDFHGFHKLAECMLPEELIDELDLCFSKFDKIIERHGLEKLKTTGHTYMCAAGIPGSNIAAARDCVDAAAEMLSFIRELRKQKAGRKEKFWDARIGINTGPVVAGVIGKKKFLYDIWGDTVNVASRILTTGLPGKINVSRSTFLEVKSFFKCRHRGKVMAKNKGKIDQYYILVRI
jgi:class 3 adenylate cyclase